LNCPLILGSSTQSYNNSNYKWWHKPWKYWPLSQQVFKATLLSKSTTYIGNHVWLSVQKYENCMKLHGWFNHCLSSCWKWYKDGSSSFVACLFPFVFDKNNNVTRVKAHYNVFLWKSQW
jgi:hypothetical protein